MAWSAEIILSEQDGLHHLYAKTSGDSEAEALAGAQFVFDAFATGRETYIRALPSAHSDTNFDSKETTHSGFVRFSFLEHDGPHHLPEKSVGFIGFGSVGWAAQ